MFSFPERQRWCVSIGVVKAHVYNCTLKYLTFFNFWSAWQNIFMVGPNIFMVGSNITMIGFNIIKVGYNITMVAPNITIIGPASPWYNPASPWYDPALIWWDASYLHYWVFIMKEWYMNKLFLKKKGMLLSNNSFQNNVSSVFSLTPFRESPGSGSWL